MFERERERGREREREIKRESERERERAREKEGERERERQAARHQGVWTDRQQVFIHIQQVFIHIQQVFIHIPQVFVLLRVRASTQYQSINQAKHVTSSRASSRPTPLFPPPTHALTPYTHTHIQIVNTKSEFAADGMSLRIFFDVQTTHGRPYRSRPGLRSDVFKYDCNGRPSQVRVLVFRLFSLVA